MTGKMRQSVAEALLALLDLVPDAPAHRLSAPETAATARDGFQMPGLVQEPASMRAWQETDAVQISSASGIGGVASAAPVSGSAEMLSDAVSAAVIRRQETTFGEIMPYRVGVHGGMAEAISPLDGDAAEALDRRFRRDSRRYDSGFSGMN